jgi:hypothetical protein
MRHKNVALSSEASAYSNWTPTRASVNLLPEELRRYIHDLESDPDIVELMRDNFALRRKVSELKKALAAKRELIVDHFDFF